jgi:DNA-binding transcriptional LysR family regulator
VLDTRRLRVFCVVAEEGSFTAAADRLYLTQSAVSQQMAILEREVGLALLERLPRGVRVTPAGELLADRARALLVQLTGIEEEVHRLVDGPRQVRLGTFATAGLHLLPAVVQRYRRRHEGNRLVVIPTQPNEVAGLLMDRSVDVGLVWDYAFAPQSHDGLPYEHLLDEPLRLLVPRGHPLLGGCDPAGNAVDTPVDLQELSSEGWVVRRHRAPYDEAFATMCRIAGFEPDVVFTTDDYPSVQGLVAAGVGVGVVPEMSLTAQHADVVAVPLTNPAFSRRIGALLLRDGRRDPAVVQLLEALHEVAVPRGSDTPRAADS